MESGHFNMAEIQQRTVLPELPDDIGARCCKEKILPYKTCSNGKTSFSFSFFFSLSLSFFFLKQIRAMLPFWRFCGGGYSLFSRNKDVIMCHVASILVCPSFMKLGQWEKTMDCFRHIERRKETLFSLLVVLSHGYSCVCFMWTVSMTWWCLLVKT